MVSTDMQEIHCRSLSPLPQTSPLWKSEVNHLFDISCSLFSAVSVLCGSSSSSILRFSSYWLYIGRLVYSNFSTISRKSYEGCALAG